MDSSTHGCGPIDSIGYNGGMLDYLPQPVTNTCCFKNRVGEVLIGFQDVVILPSRACFPPHFINIVVEVKASGQPHVLKQWLG